MHPLHAVEHALATMPTTPIELVAALPAEGPITPVTTRDNPKVVEIVEATRRRIVDENLQGATLLPTGHGWSICSSSQRHVLVGHLYPGQSHGTVAVDSPIVLLDRYTNEIYYGREIPELGRACLANFLVRKAITDIQDR